MDRRAQLVQESQAVDAQRRILGVDGDLEEEGVHRRAQGRERPHRALEVLPSDALPRRRSGGGERVGELLFRLEDEGGRIVRALEGARAVPFLFGAQNVRRAAVACQQVLPVLGVEQPPERLDPPDDREQIVLAGQGEDRVDQVVTGALVAQVDLQPVGEEVEQAGRDCPEPRVVGNLRPPRRPRDGADDRLELRPFRKTALLERLDDCARLVLAGEFDVEQRAPDGRVDGRGQREV